MQHLKLKSVSGCQTTESVVRNCLCHARHPWYYLRRHSKDTLVLYDWLLVFLKQEHIILVQDRDHVSRYLIKGEDLHPVVAAPAYDLSLRLIVLFIIKSYCHLVDWLPCTANVRERLFEMTTERGMSEFFQLAFRVLGFLLVAENFVRV